MSKHIMFHLDGQAFGMEVLQVSEILLADEIRIFEVPNAPDFLMGIINLRGMLTPIVNLGIKLGRPAGKITDKSRVIICKTSFGAAVGVLVDDLAQLVEAKDDDQGIAAHHSVPQDNADTLPKTAAPGIQIISFDDIFQDIDSGIA
ncbi:MAG: chemotaxis protein CheW [Nitrospinota bacterium]|nr:chemotaxis protein CheW [Nitrospinota bacterium]